MVRAGGTELALLSEPAIRSVASTRPVFRQPVVDLFQRIGFGAARDVPRLAFVRWRLIPRCRRQKCPIRRSVRCYRHGRQQDEQGSNNPISHEHLLKNTFSKKLRCAEIALMNSGPECWSVASFNKIQRFGHWSTSLSPLLPLGERDLRDAILHHGGR